MINNYVIGRIRSAESSAYFLGKVEAVKKGVVYGTHEKNSHIKTLRSGFEIPASDIVVDLGEDPHPGRVYGLDVGNLFKGKKHHDFFGPICFMYSPKKELSAKLMAAFEEAAKILEKAKLPEPEHCVWEVQGPIPKSKWAGYYAHSQKPEKNPHRFAIKPEGVPPTIGDFTYVILHEYAHWLHATHATGKKLNAKWVRLFNTSIKLQTIKKEHSQNLLQTMLAGQEPPSDFKGQLEEDDRNAFLWIMRAIRNDHSVSIKELDLLFEAGYHADVEALWPKVTLNKKDLKPVVSEYATVSFKELFAEAFAFHLTKRKLPDSVTTLVDNTISYAKAASGSK